MTFTFQCAQGHVTEQSLTETQRAAIPRDSEGRQVVPCSAENCNNDSIRLFSAALAVFNCHGFYGNLGTDVALNAGTVH